MDVSLGNKPLKKKMLERDRATNALSLFPTIARHYKDSDKRSLKEEKQKPVRFPTE